jgi:heptosyltransferase II
MSNCSQTSRQQSLDSAGERMSLRHERLTATSANRKSLASNDQPLRLASRNTSDEAAVREPQAASKTLASRNNLTRLLELDLRRPHLLPPNAQSVRARNASAAEGGPRSARNRFARNSRNACFSAAGSFSAAASISISVLITKVYHSLTRFIHQERGVQRGRRPSRCGCCPGRLKALFPWAALVTMAGVRSVESTSPRRILVVQPSWVGDAVMATPALRALRNRFPTAHITYLMRRNLKPIYAGMPWADRLLTVRAGRDGLWSLSRRLKQAKFDLAVLLPNSFRMALLCRMAGISRVVGYDRDGRGAMLSDKLIALRHDGRFVPTPMLEYYLALPRYLGAGDRDVTMQLFVTERQRREAAEVLMRAGLDAAIDRPGRSGRGPLVVLNPGAQYGAAKCWLPERFAAVGDHCVKQLGATVLVNSAPRERKIVEEIRSHATQPFLDLANFKPSLGAVKEIMRRCDVMVTNDTGPRHIAAAFGVPVVTVFGPTDPQWTEIWFKDERQVSVPVFCGPCQKKVCPLDHRCMTRVSGEMVIDAVMELLGKRTPLPVR